MNEPIEISTDTPMVELRERGYATTPDGDLLCACGHTLRLDPEAHVWRGEHRAGWHDRDWRDSFRGPTD